MIALFDIGSTLIEGPPYGPARRLCEMLGLPRESSKAIEHLLFRTPSKTPQDLAAHLSDSLGTDLAATEHACSELWAAQLQEAYVLPGAIEAVAALRAHHIERAYLSNIWPPFYEHFRTTFLEESAQPQFLSFEQGLTKPDKAFYQVALEALLTRDVTMIGDTYENDIRPAIELGLRTIWILHRPQKEVAALTAVLNGDAPKPDLTLTSIAQLKPEHLL
jgi:FMN phosphatase YigB (HAD superfamily)